MRLAVLPANISSDAFRPIRWAPLLPQLCCQAVGGKAESALTLSIAWSFFYSAADLLDDLEDDDIENPWWGNIGRSQALNIGTSLVFCGNYSLNQIFREGISFDLAIEILDDFQNSLIQASIGQHLDLSIANPSLNDWWKIAKYKSGNPFSLACRTGAKLATGDEAIIGSLSEFGSNLGISIQILDDTNDFQKTLHNHQSKYPNNQWSLPIVYACEVLPNIEKSKLVIEWNNLVNNESANLNVIEELVERSGATKYLETNLDLYCNKAKDALFRGAPPSDVRSYLEIILEHICLT